MGEYKTMHISAYLIALTPHIGRLEVAAREEAMKMKPKTCPKCKKPMSKCKCK